MNRQRRRESYDTTLDGRDVCIEFDRITVWSSGMEDQDADGNRGRWVTSIDEDYTEDIVVLTFGDTMSPADTTTTPLDALSTLQALEVTRLLDEYMQNYEPQEPEEENRCEYDDIDD